MAKWLKYGCDVMVWWCEGMLWCDGNCSGGGGDCGCDVYDCGGGDGGGGVMLSWC